MKETFKIKKIILRQLQMKMKAPFTTSFGTIHNKDFLLIEAVDENGLSGWGESVAMGSPWYSEETVQTSQHMLEDFLFPTLLNAPLTHPDEVSEKFSHIRRNNMAKAAVEGAVWDLYAKRTGEPLAKALGGTRDKIGVGISIGIQSSVNALLHLIDGYLTEGYQRLKLKIKPGRDVEVLREIRRVYPDVPIMADANSAYTLKDIDLLKRLDDFNLMMIEQPLEHDDIIDHAKLQKELSTPICLDESIHSVSDARKAIELGSCKIINIKIGRVGGLTESKKIHDLCAKNGIDVWCGGMLEAGVGRAHNIAITTLPQFTLPGDTAGSSRYWEEDIIVPEVTVNADGTINVPNQPGIGYEVNMKAIEKYKVSEKVFTA
ncbi:O-succinylbenzoate synthase [Pullulanibacillus pueri]|uniref:o-succinylbenzoate synthase n=1 Tax=Pullulanibacillus pueri TaxID=1437324 RepID=A0A8J2ZVK2_9BACL|nr:o-succinylbenzoate synthase [Pullulanibacillus pueri]MBM7682398.1 O-succinylbenzoate synthase [Pullulanibacillus pueri]GGH81793.1 o-succinylbenzoate synthase [Pullulanibacillus pueri]